MSLLRGQKIRCPLDRPLARNFHGRRQIQRLYTQQLLDTSVSLRKEIDNLREAYTPVNERVRAISALADKTHKDVLHEAIDVEELARLAVVASHVSNDAADLFGESALKNATGKTVQAAIEAHDLA